jgi:hypothetical protein
MKCASLGPQVQRPIANLSTKLDLPIAAIACVDRVGELGADLQSAERPHEPRKPNPFPGTLKTHPFLGVGSRPIAAALARVGHIDRGTESTPTIEPKNARFPVCSRFDPYADFSRDFRSRILISEIKLPESRRDCKRSAAAWFGGAGVGT